MMMILICMFFVYRSYFKQKQPSGFCSHKDKNTISIVFHAVIPKDVWEWDEDARVYMRFGVHELGNWDYDYGPGQVERYILIELLDDIQHISIGNYLMDSLLSNFNPFLKQNLWNSTKAFHISIWCTQTV